MLYQVDCLSWLTRPCFQHEYEMHPHCLGSISFTPVFYPSWSILWFVFHACKFIGLHYFYLSVDKFPGVQWRVLTDCYFLEHFGVCRNSNSVIVCGNSWNQNICAYMEIVGNSFCFSCILTLLLFLLVQVWDRLREITMTVSE